MGREHPILMAVNVLAKCIEVKWPRDNKAKQEHQPLILRMIPKEYFF